MKKAPLILAVLAMLGLGIHVNAATVKPSEKELACACKHECTNCSDCSTGNDCHSKKNS